MEEEVSVASSQRAGSSPFSSRPLYEHRLSVPFFIRLPTATAGAFLTGMALGLSHGSKTAGLRFRAENSHRFPTTSAGWYLYHKSKNYHAMLGGIKEGTKMGFRISFWTGSFFLVEEAVDQLRGTKDFLSTVVAGLSISGGFSAWNRFPLPTAARTSKVGLIAGLSYGLVQDALGLARGRQLGYVDFLLGKRHDGTNTNENFAPGPPREVAITAIVRSTTTTDIEAPAKYKTASPIQQIPNFDKPQRKRKGTGEKPAYESDRESYGGDCRVRKAVGKKAQVLTKQPLTTQIMTADAKLRNAAAGGRSMEIAKMMKMRRSI